MKLYHHMHKIWLLSLLEKHRVYKLAAAESMVTQSALTQNLNNLEKILGTPLVVKNNGRIELTPFAQVLVEKSRSIFDQIDNLHDPEAELKGVVKIGSYDSLAQNFLADAVMKLQSIYKNVNFQIEGGRSKDIIDKVTNGKLDFGFIIDNEDETSLEKDDVFSGKFGLYCSKGYSKAKLAEIIPHTPLISLLYPDGQSSIHLDNFFSHLYTEFEIKKPTITFSSFDSIMEALGKSDAIGVLPDFIACKNTNLQKLWFAENSDTDAHKSIIISRPMVRSQIKRKLLEFLTQSSPSRC